MLFFSSSAAWGWLPAASAGIRQSAARRRERRDPANQSNILVLGAQAADDVGHCRFNGAGVDDVGFYRGGDERGGRQRFHREIIHGGPFPPRGGPCGQAKTR